MKWEILFNDKISGNKYCYNVGPLYIFCFRFLRKLNEMQATAGEKSLTISNRVSGLRLRMLSENFGPVFWNLEKEKVWRSENIT